MDVPLSIILEELSKHTMQAHISPKENRVYKGVSMMPDPPFELVASLLHVSLLSVVVRAGGLENGQTCVCLRDRERDALETKAVLSGLIIIESDYPMEYIFHEIHSIFLMLAEWERAMLDCIIHKDIATLATLGENATGRSILITDATLSLLAFSSANAERLWERLIPSLCRKDTMKTLIGNVTEEARSETAFRLLTDASITRHPLAAVTIKINPTYSVCVLAECKGRPVNTALVDLLLIFSEFVASFVKHRLPGPLDSTPIYDRLVRELIEGKVTNPEIIKSRCEFSGLQVKAQYMLLRFQFEHLEHLSVWQVMDELSRILTEAKLLRYEDHILAVDYGSGFEKEAIGDGLAEFLERYSAVCGVSGLMYDITALHTAYAQTALAIEYGLRVRKNKLLSDAEQTGLNITPHRVLFRYEDYDLYRIIDSGSEQKEPLLKNSACLCALSKLWLNDKASRLNNLKLLYIYLLSERQSTLTAKVLHMHRNNVYYHITRIEELLGINLNDPERRTKLLMTYKMLDLYGADYLSTSDYYNSLDTDILRELCAMNKTKTIKKTLGVI